MNKPMEDAVRFIGAELKENPDADKSALIEKAARRFDLTPMQEEYLITKYIIEAE